jgi:hypothetical protein
MFFSKTPKLSTAILHDHLLEFKAHWLLIMQNLQEIFLKSKAKISIFTHSVYLSLSCFSHNRQKLYP